jgi:hypothetical protein
LGYKRRYISIPMSVKENELRRELKLKKSIPEKIIRDFGKDYFIEELNIPEDEIHLFISYCEDRQVFTYYSKGNILKILTIFNEESKKYIELKE